MNAKPTHTLPKVADWQTYGGGTSAAPGRYSYHAPISGGKLSAHGSPGTYMIDPISSDRGKHLGYRVLFCDAGGELSARGAQRGLYSDLIGYPVTLPKARKRVQEHFATHFTGEAS